MARRSSVSSGASANGSGLRPGTEARQVGLWRRPATSSSTHVEAELIRLACADTNSLARRWRVVFGHRAPDLPRALLQRILAYRIQADAAGDLDPTTIKLLDRLGRGEIAEIPLPELRAVKPGTLLVREWEGTLQRVVVLESGFAWNGGHLREPVQGRPCHHGHELERPSLLWAA